MNQKKNGEAKLGAFLREVSNWRYDDFVRAEKDPKYSANQAVVFGLVRACTIQKLPAIKLALDRIDGKLKTPLKIELPKIYTIYPNAKLPEKFTPDENGEIHGLLPGIAITGVNEIVVHTIEPEPDALEGDEDELLDLSLRETLSKMSDFPRNVPADIVQSQVEIDAAVRDRGPMPFNIPLVKSVIAANLLLMAQERNLDAVYEVFDHIDGKLAETIEVLGEDVFIVSYLTEAPAGAYLNADGILQVEADSTTRFWEDKWGQKAL